MGFFLINKEKVSKSNIKNEYLSSFEVFRRRGSKVREVIENNNFTLTLFDELNTVCYKKEFQNGDFIITLGTLIYKSRYGDDCLNLLYSDFNNKNFFLYNDLIGSYCVIVFIKEKLYIFNDFLGLMRVYNTIDNSIYSSSFIALAKALKTKTPSSQEIFEYIIRGGMYGDKTILKEINLIPRSTIVSIDDIKNNGKIEYSYERLPFYNNYNKMVDYVSNQYLELFNIITKTFGNNITTALSGGYDSRLMVALLRRNGITPDMYVYGKDNSSDVIIAKNIAKSEDFYIEHINKDSFDKIEIDDYADVIEKNFYFFDGLGNGGIFDNGTDVATRESRSLGGKLQLNGAGGEIWRNFWQLNSFEKKSIDFVRHKWDIFNYEAFTDEFSKKEYFTSFTKKLEKSINKISNKKKLTRKEMEISYPLFRYRYWQSIGNSTNLHFSNTLMPLMETSFLYPSFDLPIKYKYNGVFEASLINKIDPRLAKYPSNYGHNFIDNVSIKKRFRSLMMRNIPLIIKPYLRYKFSNNNEEIIPYFLDKKYLMQVVDLDNAFISKYVNLHKMNDLDSFSRALTLEYFFKQI